MICARACTKAHKMCMSMFLHFKVKYLSNQSMDLYEILNFSCQYIDR